jgi:hypothetical protein
MSACIAIMIFAAASFLYFRHQERRGLSNAPPPRWVGVFAYAGALALVAFVFIDAFRPPADWPIHLTWPRRLGLISLAITLVWAGTRVLQGKA